MPQLPITEAREAPQVANLKRAERAAGVWGKGCCLEEKCKAADSPEVIDADRLRGRQGTCPPQASAGTGCSGVKSFSKENWGEGLPCLSSNYKSTCR